MASGDDLSRLRAIPWCRRLIEDPTIVVTNLDSRTYKTNGEDNLFSRTLNTRDTIESVIILHKKKTPETKYIEEVLSLMTVGNMMDSQSKIVHGGIVSTILDEITGLLFAFNKELGKGDGRGYSVTAYLNVTYLRPILTPGTILVKARLKKVEGKKRYADGEIQDSAGNVLARSEALFVATKETKL